MKIMHERTTLACRSMFIAQHLVYRHCKCELGAVA